MEKHLYKYKIKVTEANVIDGDTLKNIVVDLGFNVFKVISIRLNRIDMPETRTRDLEEKRLGKLAANFLKLHICNKDNVYINVVKKGKYGRWIAEIYLDEKNINTLMVKTGHASWY